MESALAPSLERYQRHVNTGLARLARLTGAGIAVRAQGCHLFDHLGEKYLDCGGYCVFLLGHCHPRVVKAVQDQVGKHPLSSRILINDELAQAAARLAEVAPAGLDYVWFANSGAEAVEAGLKLARLHDKRRVIAMEGSYHGKTLGALSVTSNPLYRNPYQPLLPDVELVPFGDAGALGTALANGGANCCVIIEPVQSERGVVIPPDGYLKRVFELCRETNAFLIFDEISVGLGRIGHWWAADREGAVPDVLLAGKALSGGVVPVSAAICSAAAYQPLNRDPMLHTSTFGGNPLACVAAKTTIDVIQDEDIVGQSRCMGEQLRAELQDICQQACPGLVSEVRGLGLLLGIEFISESLAGQFFVELIEQRVLASHSLNAHRVVRLTPPALMSEDDIQWLLTAVGEASSRIAARHYY